MRKFSLANPDFKYTTDLVPHSALIKSTVQNICPKAVVQISHDSFTIVTSITKGEAIKIGRALAHTVLGKYCLQRPILFVGKEI